MKPMLLPDLNVSPSDADTGPGDTQNPRSCEAGVTDCSNVSGGRRSCGGAGCTVEPPPTIPADVETETSNFPPRKGMRFPRLRHVLDYYREYAKQLGFPTRIEGTQRVADRGKNVEHSAVPEYGDDAVKIRLHCAKGGKHRPSGVNPKGNSTSMKTDCPARINANIDRELGNWKITHVVLEHNHDFEKQDGRFYAQYRGMTEADIRKVLNNDSAGIPIAQTYASFAVENEGWSNVPFRERDLRNALNNARRQFVDKGDFIALQNLFRELAKCCPDFYYSFNQTEDGVLRNVFWADGRCRAAYREFGDVISFDATYLKNRYKMPFTPFIGVNHHGQSTLFGCALISNEETETYEWVFSEFLKCMGGKAPKGILTDQCPAMGNAVGKVMPATSHRWCIWHVKENANRAIIKHPRYDDVKQDLDRAVYNMLTIDLFEEAWAAMVTKYNLQCNKWMKKMYGARRKWAPVYFRHQFWAGMSSTQRSEGMNNYFRGYFNENTTLVQFGEQYNLAHAKRVEDEAEATHSSLDRPVVCKTIFSWEQDVRALYTSKKFIEFQKQLCCIQYQVESLIEDTGDIREYTVEDSSHRAVIVRKEGVKYTVVFKVSTAEVWCVCKKFEFRGILCKHALRVLQREKVKEIPSRYILRRWRKDVARTHLKYSVPLYGPISRRPESMALTKLQRAFEQAAEVVVHDPALCEEFRALMEGFRENACREACDVHETTTRVSGEGLPVAMESETSIARGSSCRVPVLGKRRGSPVKDPPDLRTPGRTRKYRHGHYKKKPKITPPTPPAKEKRKTTAPSKANNVGKETKKGISKDGTGKNDVGHSVRGPVWPKDDRTWLAI